MHAEIENGRVVIYDSYMFREAIKEIAGREYDPQRKAWHIPATAENVENLKLLGCRLSAEVQALSYQGKPHAPEPEQRPVAPMPILGTALQHQVRGFNMACSSMGIEGGKVKSPGFALFFEMGLGKTVTSIAIAGRAYLNGMCKRLLVLCPKTILDVWEAEMTKFANYPNTVALLKGSGAKKVKTLHALCGDGLEVAVVNYESAVLLEKELIAWRPDFIIADESSKIKNPSAKVSKAAARIAKGCRFRLALTGTPILNNLLDLYSQFRFLDESVFGLSFYAFKNKYAILGTFQQPVGWRSVGELLEKVNRISLRVTKEEALDLPDTLDEVRPVVLEDSAQRQYKQLAAASVLELERGEITATNVLTRILRLQQFAGGFLRADGAARYEQVSRAKLEALEDIVDDCIANGRKAVIIARFLPELKAICAMLETKKLPGGEPVQHALVYGAVKDRAAEVAAFQNDADCLFFVGQLKTVAMGLTLTAAALEVFYSYDYNYGDYSQARARIHRIGQQSKCLYIHLMAKDTADESVLQVLQGKGTIAAVLDNWRAFV